MSRNQFSWLNFLAYPFPILSFRLVVSQNQKALHIVFPHQFLDSPEWFGVSTDDYFQVSIMAMEESEFAKNLHVKSGNDKNDFVYF